jgi:hypothetical protein
MKRLMASPLILTLVIAIHGVAMAQVMSRSEYQSFIKRFDANIPQWQRVFGSLNVDDLPVSYAIGRLIAGNQEIALKNLEQIHKVIVRELIQPRLSHQILIDTSLSDIISSQTEVEALLPNERRHKALGSSRSSGNKGNF